MTPARCLVIEPHGGICGEPVLVGQVCYDHAIMGSSEQPLCPLTCSEQEWLQWCENQWRMRRTLTKDRCAITRAYREFLTLGDIPTWRRMQLEREAVSEALADFLHQRQEEPQ